MINVHSKVSGRYRITVQNSDGSIRKETGWFDNLVTNNGLDLMYNSDYLTACAVGTNNATPAVTDTQLGGLLASTATIQSSNTGKQLATPPYYVYTQNSYRFAQGAVVGNVAEVGVGLSSTNLFSRALVLDGSGNPTTITVLSDEILVVEYEMRLQIPGSDTSGTFTDNGTTYNWTARALFIDSETYWVPRVIGPRMRFNSSTVGFNAAAAHDGSIGTVFQSPGGARATAGPGTPAAYTAGSYQTSGTFVFGIDSANFATGITAFTFSSIDRNPAYQFGVSPAIMKTSADQLTMSVSYSWGRA